MLGVVKVLVLSPLHPPPRLQGDAVPGGVAVLGAVAADHHVGVVALPDGLHHLVEAEGADDEAGRGAVAGRDEPRPAPALLLGPLPLALEEAVAVGVVVKQLEVALVVVVAAAEVFSDGPEGRAPVQLFPLQLDKVRGQVRAGRVDLDPAALLLLHGRDVAGVVDLDPQAGGRLFVVVALLPLGELRGLQGVHGEDEPVDVADRDGLQDRLVKVPFRDALQKVAYHRFGPSVGLQDFPAGMHRKIYV